MIRTTLDKAYIKRTIRPNYGWTQATPKSGFLDPAWDRSIPIWPGMALSRTTGALYTLTGAGMAVSGLSGLYIGGDGIDEPKDQGVNAIAVWVLDPDAEFEILAPAFDTTAAWVDNTPGSDVLLYARAANTGGVVLTGSNPTGMRGQLVPAGTAGTLSSQPCARLLSVVSPTKIVIGGLRGTV